MKNGIILSAFVGELHTGILAGVSHNPCNGHRKPESPNPFMKERYAPFPDKKYSVIYCDPPWHYNSSSMSSGSAPTNYYPDMLLSDLKELPVKQIADDNCLLFLWAVSPALDEAFELGASWGFKYATVGFVWDKHTPVTGNYTMSQCEICLIFKRGNIPQPRGARNVRQFLSCKRVVTPRSRG